MKSFIVDFLFLIPNIHIICAINTSSNISLKTSINEFVNDNVFYNCCVKVPPRFAIEGFRLEKISDNISNKNMPSNTTDLSPAEYSVSKSQDSSDIFFYENFFYGVRNGVILESGAIDGIRFSNSLFFEQVLGWKSVHIEADPENFRQLVTNRPDSINVNSAICKDNRTLHWTSGKSGPATRAIVEFSNWQFLRKFAPAVFNNPKLVNELETVRCSDFASIASLINLRSADIFVLDIEGAELSVLKNINFKNFPVSVLMVECEAADAVAVKREKLRILSENGFICKHHWRDCICKHKDFKRRSKPAKMKRKIDKYVWETMKCFTQCNYDK